MFSIRITHELSFTSFFSVANGAFFSSSHQLLLFNKYHRLCIVLCMRWINDFKWIILLEFLFLVNKISIYFNVKPNVIQYFLWIECMRAIKKNCNRKLKYSQNYIKQMRIYFRHVKGPYFTCIFFDKWGFNSKPYTLQIKCLFRSIIIKNSLGFRCGLLLLVPNLHIQIHVCSSLEDRIFWMVWLLVGMLLNS